MNLFFFLDIFVFFVGFKFHIFILNHSQMKINRWHHFQPLDSISIEKCWYIFATLITFVMGFFFSLWAVVIFFFEHFFLLVRAARINFFLSVTLVYRKRYDWERKLYINCDTMIEQYANEFKITKKKKIEWNI